jgi:hypothetical protein
VSTAVADDNTWKEAILTSSVSLSVGQLFAIKVSTFGQISSQAGNLQMLSGGGALRGNMGLFPYLMQDRGGGIYSTYSAGGAGAAWEMVTRWSSNGVIPVTAMTPTDGAVVITSYHGGSATNEHAMRFQVPFSARVAGLGAYLLNKQSSAAFSLSLWSALASTDAAALGQVKVSTNVVSAVLDGYYEAFLSSQVVLSPNSTYYVGLRADTSSTTSTVSLGFMNVTTGISSAMRAFPMPYGEIYRAQRGWTNGTSGAWTNFTTSLPLCYLMIDQLDDGVQTGGGGGSMLVHPGLAGGARG